MIGQRLDCAYRFCGRWCVDDHVGNAMTRTLLSALFIAALSTTLPLVPGVSARCQAQDNAQSNTTQSDTAQSETKKSETQDGAKEKDSTTETASPASKRLTVEVTGGEKNVSVENASVYLKFSEGRILRKDRKYELNVKTNRDGTAHIPDPPLGRVLIQIVADGWKTYGKYYELTDPGAVIKIHLDRPPKWY